jgi:hypothetical protein
MDRFRLGFALLLLAAAGLAQAGVYKWVDEKGVTHYSSTPHDSSSQQVKVQPPAAPASENSSSSSNMRLWEANESMKRSREQRQQRDEMEKREREEKSRRCDAARQRLQSLQDHGRIFSRNQQGEKEYWDDATKEAEIKKAQDAIKNNC